MTQVSNTRGYRPDCIIFDEIATFNDDAFTPMKSKRMVAVPRAPLPTHDEMRGCCLDSYKLFGGLGYCKRHSPYVTRQHMTLGRYIYWQLRHLLGV